MVAASSHEIQTGVWVNFIIATCIWQHSVLHSIQLLAIFIEPLVVFLAFPLSYVLAQEIGISVRLLVQYKARHFVSQMMGFLLPAYKLTSSLAMILEKKYIPTILIDMTLHFYVQTLPVNTS